MGASSSLKRSFKLRNQSACWGIDIDQLQRLIGQRIQHKTIKKVCESSGVAKRQNLRDVLVRAHDDHQAVAFIDWLKQSPATTGFDAVQIAGDAGRLSRLKREKDGIEVDEQTWQEIVAPGKKVGAVL